MSPVCDRSSCSTCSGNPFLFVLHVNKKEGETWISRNSWNGLAQFSYGMERMNEFQRAVSALGALPHDCDSGVAVAAAMKREFGDEAASAVISWWGSGHPDEPESVLRTKWDRLGDHPGAAGLGTLFHLARQAGWSGALGEFAPSRSTVPVPGPEHGPGPGLGPGPGCVDPLVPDATLGEFWETRIWLVSQGKSPGSFFQGNILRAYRQSRGPGKGGVKLARYGGDVRETSESSGREYRLRVLPWLPYHEVLELLSIPAGSRFGRGAAPAVSLAGDATCPAGHRFAVLDADYRPELDSSGDGRVLRDRWLRAAQDLGVPVFRSRGGEGFHAVFQYSAADIEAGRWPARKGVKGLDGAIGIDLFLPGSRSMVGVSRDRALGDYRPDLPLPQVGLDQLLSLVRGRVA